MKYTFGSADLNDLDFEKIFELDKRNYEKKYLLSVEDVRNRYDRNPNIYFSLRDSKSRLIGYFSAIPLKKKAYYRIKNGEIDKDVITIEDIIPSGEEVTNIYLDSIIIESKYRRYRLGGKFNLYAFEQISELYPNYKRVVANAVSKGGLRLLEKRGLHEVEDRKVDLLIAENVIKGKTYARKKTYKNRDKHRVEAKKVRKNAIGSCVE